jgi:hypothetical protein
MSTIKDAKPGERWEFGNSKGIVVEFLESGRQMAVCRYDGVHIVMGLMECGNSWRKTHNSDGTPYEESKPLPDFGECWAARDKNGNVYVFVDMPLHRNGNWYADDGQNDDSCFLGKISFRPELPWHQTACKVRVRLEVVE